MGAEYGAAGARSIQEGSTPTVPGLPAGVTAGQLMLLHDTGVHHSGLAPEPTTPAGWTPISSVAVAGNSGEVRITWWWRRYQAGDSAPSVAWAPSTTGAKHYSRIHSVPGAPATGDPIAVVGTAARTTASTTQLGPIPGVAAPAGSLVFVAGTRPDDFNVDGATNSFSTLTGDGLTWVEVEDIASAPSDDLVAALDYAVVTTATTITSKTFTTISGASSVGQGQMLVIAGESAAPAQTITPATIAAPAGPGAPTVVSGARIAPGTIPAPAAPGQPTVLPGPVTITPATIPAPAAPGAPQLNLTIAPTPIPAPDAPAAPTVQRAPRPPLRVDFWALADDGSILCPLPHPVSWDLSLIPGEDGAVRIEYPVDGLNFSALRDRVTRDRDLYIHIRTDGTLDNALGALLHARDGDEVAESGTVTFIGSFLTALLRGGVLPYNTADPEGRGETAFASATPGGIMNFALAAAQADGDVANLTWTFTADVDSRGLAWPTDQLVSPRFSPGKTMLDLAQQLRDWGLCEFEVTTDLEVRLYVPETVGVDRTLSDPPLVLRTGRDLLEAPRRTDVGDSPTDLVVAGKDGLYVRVFDATARARRGRQITKFISEQSLSDTGSLTAYAQNALKVLTSGVDERTHSLTFDQDHPTPLREIFPADWVYSDTGGGFTAADRSRIVQLTVSREAGEDRYSGGVVLNDLISERDVSLQRQLDRLTSGSTVVGTSQPPPVADTVAPAAPTGVVVDSIAYDDGLGGALALVSVGWAQVSFNVDGTAATDVAGYRVELAYAAAPNAWRQGRDVDASATSTTIPEVSAGVVVRIRVFCYDRDGNTSAASAVVEHLTQNDLTAPPTPSTPTAFSRLGVLMVEWDGLGSAGEAMPADFDYVEVHMSEASNFATTAATYYDRLYAAGTMPVVDQAFGVAKFFKLVAVDRTTPVANRSDSSGQATATPSKVVSDDIFAGAVGTLALADLAVKTAKIDNLAVNDAQFGSGSFGKITAGVMSVAMTLTGIIRTATTGLRWEGDSAGVRFYNSSGTNTIRLEGASGNTLITGTLQSGMTGTRWVMHPLGELRLYGNSGTDYARIYNFENGNDVVLRGRLDANSRSGRFNAGPLGCGMNFSSEAEIPDSPRAEIVAEDRKIRMQAPVTAMRINRALSTPDGGTHRIEFFSGDSTVFSIGGSRLEYLYNASGGSGENIQLRAPILDCNIAYRPGVLLVRNTADNAYIPINASAFNVNSSEARKRDISDVGIDRAALRAKVRAVVPKRYKLTSEVDRPAKPGTRSHAYRMVDGERVRDATGRPVLDLVDDEWAAPLPPARDHIGFIAENLREHFPDLVSTDPADPAAFVVDVVGALAVLWKQVSDLVADSEPNQTPQPSRAPEAP